MLALVAVLLGPLPVAFQGSRRQAAGAAVVVTVAATVARPDHALVIAAVGLAGGAIALLIAAQSARIRSLMADVRRHAEEARHAEAALDAVGRVARTLTTPSDARRRVCEVARSLTAARLACLLEPEGPGRLVSTAMSGSDLLPVRVGPVDEPSAALGTFSGGQRTELDLRSQSSLAPRALLRADLRRLVFEPVLRDGRPLGVLVLGWDEPGSTPPPPDPTPSATADRTLRLLADAAASAIGHAELLADLDALARTDSLTGLPNRRAWEDLLHRELAYARRSRHPLSLAILDLDRFKTYNDTLGHQAGDRLLKVAAASWRSVLREVDVLARWGGEEFAVLLPACSQHDAVALVERLRLATPDGQTCSAGIATWDGMEAAESLVGRADQALYAAKSAGRDRTVAA